MESNKLSKTVRDWATNLGFRLPDGSTPPANYFALLTATPHRRQLWETIVESVQSRQKVKQMRKQILVAKLQYKKVFTTNHSGQVSDRIDLWQKQIALETEIKKERNSIIELEKNILGKASDLMFEFCKLKELEKEFQELGEKSLVLRLLTKREQKMAENLEKLLNLKEALSPADKIEKKEVIMEKLDCIKRELLSAEECKCMTPNNQSCKILNRIKEFWKLGITEQFLWEEIIKCKKDLFFKFSEILKELNPRENNTLSEKEIDMEKNLNLSVMQLKQKLTEKSLQVIINSVEGKLLDSKIEKLLEVVGQKGSLDGTSNGIISFLLDKRGEAFGEEHRYLENFRSYSNALGLRSYCEFLMEELKRLEEVAKKDRKDPRKNSKSGQGKEEVWLTAKAFESTADEINSFESKQKEIEREIIGHHDKLQALVRLMKEKVERKGSISMLNATAVEMKIASEKQIDVFSRIPSDAFRTIETSSRLAFERESKSHCLKNYGGEFKQFFSTMLIPPLGDTQKILLEVSKRREILSRVKKFISERDKLAATQRKVHDQLSSIKYDSQLCEKNFKECDGILRNMFFKTDELIQEVDFIEKILKNWVEQPYRLMIKETTEKKSLSEYEEKNKKGTFICEC